MIEREFAEETFSGGVFPLQRSQAFGLRDVQAATLAPPPIQGLRGAMLLATDVAPVSQRLRFWSNPTDLCSRTPVAWQTPSR
jgi:hypothetical protein